MGGIYRGSRRQLGRRGERSKQEDCEQGEEGQSTRLNTITVALIFGLLCFAFVQMKFCVQELDSVSLKMTSSFVKLLV